MVYIALLRGINVGGKNKIDMKLLKQTFEQVGMKDVVTYINTGNIIFSYSGISKKELSRILEEAIHNDFGLPIKVVIRSVEDVREIINAIPDNWQNDKGMTSDVMFLWDEIDDASVMANLVIKPDIDTVKYVPGAILWSVDKKNVTKSGKSKIIGSKIYKQVTVRNVNTTRKIYELMQAQNRANIEIKIISSDNWRKALDLSVHDKQMKFVASVNPPVAIALAKAYIRPGGKMVEPYGIYHQKKMVGFFNLHYTPDSTDDYWLFHFFIDKRFQRNGLGSKALNELIRHIKQNNPSCKRLCLTVHPENEAGRLFYLKFGFLEDHILTFDEPTFSIFI